MTLTAWFREYIFYPLERRRIKFAGQQINILFVFFLTGLWHGFNPTFILWGLLHGFALAIESAGFGRVLKKIWQPLRHFYTLLIVSVGWIFFRSNSISFGLAFIFRLLGNTSGITPLPFSQTTPLPFIEPSFIIVLIFAIIFTMPIRKFWIEVRDYFMNNITWLFILIQPLEDIFQIAIFILSLAAALSSTYAPTIYSNF